jgi:hypothetical protein
VITSIHVEGFTLVLLICEHPKEQLSDCFSALPRRHHGPMSAASCARQRYAFQFAFSAGEYLTPDRRMISSQFPPAISAAAGEHP